MQIFNEDKDYTLFEKVLKQAKESQEDERLLQLFKYIEAKG